MGRRSSEEPIDEVTAHVGSDRRTFVRRLVIGTAFAVPIVEELSAGGHGR